MSLSDLRSGPWLEEEALALGFAESFWAAETAVWPTDYTDLLRHITATNWQKSWQKQRSIQRATTTNSLRAAQDARTDGPYTDPRPESDMISQIRTTAAGSRSSPRGGGIGGGATSF